MEPDPEITLPRMEAFMRQFAHDICNGLNSLDLEIGLLKELISQEDGLASASRASKQVRHLADQVRAVSLRFQKPAPVLAPLLATELMLIWREVCEKLPQSLAVSWRADTLERKVNVDPEMMAKVFRELLNNARIFGDGSPVVVTARNEGRLIVFELLERKSTPVNPEGWGERMFQTTRHGGLGLGLWTVRRLLEANQATFVQKYLPEEGTLSTKIVAHAISK